MSSKATTTGPRYRMAAPAGPAAAPVLDADQRRVVEHAGGPLLVLAGPGTGKTTTLVEAIVERVERRGIAPERVLALTFSRKAAEQLRDRVARRLGRTTATATCATLHSFAYGLVRRYAPLDLYAGPLRLLSAAEQDVVVAELLTDAPESVVWPEALRRAVGTRGFAREVHALLARARESGLGADDLIALGAREGADELSAAGRFLSQYLDVLDDHGAIDYADLVRRATIEANVNSAEVRGRYDCVLVDEYQDTDDGQVALVQAVTGPGAEVIAVGDPRQSIYGFRGARPRGILEFPDRFRDVRGAPAPVVVLRTTRRSGPRILRAAGRVAERMGTPAGVPSEVRVALGAPLVPAEAVGDRVEVLTFDTERAEAEHLADVLRRAHLEDDVPWGEMAVLVRSGGAVLSGLRRSLGVAGVPVEVAADEVPLGREPVLAPLLDALRAVAHADERRPEHRDFVPADVLEGLLISPLAQLDPTQLRSYARRLRASWRAAHPGAPSVPPSADLVRARLLDDPATLAPLSVPDDDTAARAGERAVAGLRAMLDAGRTRLASGASVEEVLWELWSATSWPERLRDRAHGSGASARRAHRDLDVICALFDAAARAEEQRGHTGAAEFLDLIAAQEIPADTLAESGVRGDAVRLLTAHRSKGLEWRLVVVAHVQEETWPDLRHRASLLDPSRLGPPGSPLLPPAPRSEILAEERRLFYVACTRARRRLVITAVRSPDDDGEQPSRLLAETGVAPEHRIGRPARPLSMAGVVAHLRRVVADPERPEPLREAAARRLALLASLRGPGDRALVRGADPASWWGTRALSRSAVPVRAAEEPVRISASTLSSLTTCALRWFLEREAGGVSVNTASQGFGLVLHALAEKVATGELSDDPADIDRLMEHVDAVWSRLSFRTPWSGPREREEARAALVRFLQWHRRGDARSVIGVEERLTARVRLQSEEVIVHGFADRLEIDDQHRVVVVDLKTGKYPPTEAEVVEHPQLGLYQLAVLHGAADHLVPAEHRPARPGGAELLHLRKQTRGAVKVQHQPPLEAPDGDGDGDGDGPLLVEQQLTEAVAVLREERFAAQAGGHCDTCAFQHVCPVKSAGTVLS